LKRKLEDQELRFQEALDMRKEVERNKEDINDDLEKTVAALNGEIKELRELLGTLRKQLIEK